MRFTRIIAAAAMLFAGVFTAAEAVPITYTLQSTFTGSVGATSFTDAAFTWTITADTSMLVPYAPGVGAMPALTSTIDITGFGTVTTTDSMAAIFAPPIAAAVFGSPLILSGIEFFGPPLTGYDGLTAIGPVLLVYEAFTPIATDQGDWIFTTTAGIAFFQATGGNVPEPVTLALFGAGLAGLGALRRRKA